MLAAFRTQNKQFSIAAMYPALQLDIHLWIAQGLSFIELQESL